MKRAIVVTIVVLCMFVASVASVGAADRLVITSGGVCICHAPVYVAMNKGIFEKHGLDVQLMRVSSGFEALAAVQTGDAHVADAVVAVVAQAAQQGINVTAVLMANGDASGEVATDNYFAIVGRRRSGVVEGDLSSLVGKTIGVPTGTIGHQYLYYALKDNGFDPTKDVKIQHVAPADLPSVLQSGSVDAIAGWEPTPLLALEMISDAVEAYRGGNHIQYLFHRWMKPEFVENNPDVVERFVTAFVEAAQYARQNPDETVRILSRDFMGLSDETIKTSLSYLTFDARVSKATLESVEQGLQFAQQEAGLDAQFDFLAHTSLDALNKVLAERPELFSDLTPIPASLQR